MNMNMNDVKHVIAVVVLSDETSTAVMMEPEPHTNNNNNNNNTDSNSDSNSNIDPDRINDGTPGMFRSGGRPRPSATATTTTPGSSSAFVPPPPPATNRYVATATTDYHEQVPIAEVVHQLDDEPDGTNDMAVAQPLSGCLCYFHHHNLLRYGIALAVTVTAVMAATICILLLRPDTSTTVPVTVPVDDVENEVVSDHHLNHTEKHNNDNNASTVVLIESGSGTPTTTTTTTTTDTRIELESSELTQLRTVLGSVFTDEHEHYLYETDTPQYQALQWLANTDDYAVSRFQPHWDEASQRPHLIQRYAAAVLYYATGGPYHWSEQFNFLAPMHECYWNNGNGNGNVDHHTDQSGTMGLLCDPQARTVQYVMLFSNSMVGTIPNEVGSFQEMKMFYLGGNMLRGRLPPSLSNLTQLTDVHLCCNQLTGTVPYLGNLDRINLFSIWNNGFHGSLADTGFTGMFGATQLVFTYNNFTGTVPAAIGNMTALRSLWLQGNRFTGTIPPSLGRAVGLIELRLAYNRLTGSVPDDLGNLTRLQTLDVSHNALTGTVPASVGSLTGLTSVNLARNDLHGDVNFWCDDDNTTTTTTTTIADLQADCVSEVQCDCCSVCF